MNTYFYDLLDKTGFFQPGYQEGLIVGIIITLAILFILRLFIIFLTPGSRRCRGIYAKGETGAIFVSSSAISDLIDALESDFDGIRFSKSYLLKKKSKYSIKILVVLDNKDISFPDLIESIRNKVFDSLSNNLGIDCIEKIDVHLSKVRD